MLGGNQFGGIYCTVADGQNRKEAARYFWTASSFLAFVNK
jgi:hypothetical protein